MMCKCGSRICLLLCALVGGIPELAVARADVSISNGLVTLRFDEAAFGLEQIGAEGFDIALDPSEPLWSVHLYDPALATLDPDDLIPVSSTGGGSLSHTFSAGGDTLTLSWTGITLDDGGILDCDLTVALPIGDTRATLWSRTALHDTDLELWAINAPRFKVWEESAGLTLDRAILPLGGGCVVEDPAEQLDLDFFLGEDLDPHHSSQWITHPGMPSIQQYHLYDETGECGLLYGTVDPTGWMKRIAHWGLGNAIRVGLRHYPPHGEGLSRTWEMPYQAFLEPFRGDWVDAALGYRERVLDMPWMAPGPLHERPDVRTPALEEALTVIYPVHGDTIGLIPPDTLIARLTEVADLMGPDVRWGAHCRSWRWKEFSFDPGFLWYPEVQEVWDVLDDWGVRCMPYTSTRDLPQWAGSWSPHYEQVARTYNGELYYSPPHDSCRILCPGSEWRQAYPVICGELLSQTGVTDPYNDNFPKAFLCHHPHHDHAPGGGDYWISGYLDMLSALRSGWPDAALTNEARCEYLIPELDFFLAIAWDQKDPGWFAPSYATPVPLIQAVYHDRIGMRWSMVTPHSWSDALAYRFVQGWSWVNGNRLSVFIPETAAAEWPSDEVVSLDYLRDLAALHGALPDHAIYGRWTRPPVLTGFSPATVPFIRNTGLHAHYQSAAVLGGCLVSPDGHLALLLTNFTGGFESGTAAVDLEEASVGAGPWEVWELAADLTWTYHDTWTGGTDFARDIALGPHASTVLVLRPEGWAEVEGRPGSRFPRLRLTAWPNPCHGRAVISLCGLPVATGASGGARAAVHDAQGRRVRSLAEPLVDGGQARWTWDGNDDAGRPAPSGVYFVRTRTAGGSVLCRRIELLR